MRNALVLALAPYIGQELTPERARAIVEQFPVEGKPVDFALIPPRTCGRLVFAPERILDILPELDILHRAHWKETEGYYRGQKMNPDYEAGLADEQAGKLLQLTARHQGVLVGNIRMYLHAKSRHTGLPFAAEDTVYLLPEFRGGLYALRFLEYMEDCMWALGMKGIYMDDKIANASAGRLMDFMGYEHIANRRYKILTGGRYVPRRTGHE